MSIDMKGIIYKLINDRGDIFYGFTTNNHLSKKLYKHYSDFEKGKIKHTNIIFKDANKVIINVVEYIKIDEIENRFNYYINNSECLNKVVYVKKI